MYRELRHDSSSELPGVAKATDGGAGPAAEATRSAPRQPVLNLPNFLTLLRIVAIPIFLILLTDGNVGAALVVFILAGITDSLDGAIARLMNARTTLGSYMDPLADKMLILSTFLVLAFMNAVPRWLTVVVISRDVVILTGYVMLFLMTQQRMEIRPSALSKASTFFHLLTLSVVLFVLWRPSVVPASSLAALFLVTGVLTSVSGIQYMARGLRWYQQTGGSLGSPMT